MSEQNGTFSVFCSNCGKDSVVTAELQPNFCSLCGSKDIMMKTLTAPVEKQIPLRSVEVKGPILEEETEPVVCAESTASKVIAVGLDCFGSPDDHVLAADPIAASDRDFKFEVADAPEQGTDKWLAWRKQGITATEAASIMFPDSHSSPMTVYSEKLGLTQHDQSDPDGFMEWGHRIEDLLVAKFMERHEKFSHCTQGRLYQRDWCKCSLDAQCFDEHGEPVIIECKTGQNAAKWNPIPDRYMAQVQWQMYVTGIRKAYFSVLICGHQWFEKQVDFNPLFVEKMLARCFQVWDCIQLKTPPARLGFSSADKQAIAAMAGESGHAQPPEKVDEDTVAKFKRLKEAADKATEEFEAFKNSLAFKMVDHSRLVREDGRSFATWVERKGSVSVNKEYLQMKYPDIYKECLKTGAPTRYVKYNV